ncbi:MAG: DUF881 domain-containing protein [Frankia sp.]
MKRRLWPDLRRPRRPGRSRVAVWVLLAVLGFGITLSVRAHSGSAGLTNARPDDLVRILDDLDAKGRRLQSEVDSLQESQSRLSGSDSAAEALADARTRAEGLAILAGTVGAQGPGIEVTIDDSGGRVGADILVDAIQELRDAGAEALQLGTVRVIASTAVVDATGGGVTVDGRHVDPPYRILAIGDAHTLAQAMQIPGGVLDTVASRDGAVASVTTPALVRITAVRP